ncbi:hypothetical protein [Methanosarcina sp. 2.H.A.1B.4]|uniref:hypothetical protein n=1 Tax=Methanosarcina sp. 2.H.A.1B.4 TaxID=1483600 RepID=UPI000620F26A|nr:hypothetical protein [Methanosarcina sp. 2.H.A.1B.4]KKG08809.1 hypothetical protein EO92_13430 [Methanosarcina sp. 2.H.A.1B.4]
MNIESTLNMILIFLLASIIVLIAMFAYAKYSAKKSQEMELGVEAERELMKAEKEREEIRKTEETGYSERDEREEHEDDESDDDGE